MVIRDRSRFISSKIRRVSQIRASNALDIQNTTPNITSDVFGGLEGFNLNGFIQDIDDVPFALDSTCDILRAKSSRHDKTVAVKRIRGFLVKDVSYAKVCIAC